MRKTVKKKGKMIVNATRIIVDGIQFASTLESRMYLLLKEAGIKSAYEGKTYTTFKGFAYPEECYERYLKKNKFMVNRPSVLKIDYTPDFVGENEEFIIEVKGRPNESFPLRWKLFKALMNQRENPPIIFKPSTVGECEQVIKILKEKGYGRK